MLQRVILRSILDKVPVSEVATAYVKGRGILYNAEQHVGQRWNLKLDFRSFFPSIGPKDKDRVVRRTKLLSGLAKDAPVLHRILFWGRGESAPKCLSIGAPTSPSVSNLVCVRLDEWMIEHAALFDVRVTRYADDITISGDSISKLLKFERSLQNLLKNSKGLRLTLHDEKRGLYGPGERKMVTGLVLTPDGAISIGRERKREISALIHRYTLHALDEQTLMRTRGLVAFASSVEPHFVASMSTKYGEDTLHRLRTGEDGDEVLFPDDEL